jgi:hypothetical protein
MADNWEKRENEILVLVAIATFALLSPILLIIFSALLKELCAMIESGGIMALF